MGRIAEMILRGEQHAVQREAADLDRVAKTLRLEDMMQERASERKRTTPGYVRAWDQFTDPDTPTEKLGGLAAYLNVIDIPKAQEARQERITQRIQRSDDMATIAMRARMAALQEEKDQAARMDLERFQQGEMNKREGMQQGGAMERLKIEEAGRDKRDADPAAKPLTPAQEKTIINQARDTLMRDKFGLSPAELKSDKVALPEEMKGISKEDVTQKAEQASLKVLDLVRQGMVLEDAIEEVGSALDYTPMQGSWKPGGLGDKPAAFKEADPEVEGMLKSAGWADTPENRSKVKAFLQKKKGG